MKFKNVLLIKDVIIVKSSRFFSVGYARQVRLSLKNIIYRIRIYKETETELLEKGCWITDEKSVEYYHWIAETLPRLMQMKQDDLYKYPVLLPEKFEKKKYILDSLNLLDVQYVFFNSECKTRIKELYLTKIDNALGKFNNTLLNKLRDQLYKIINIKDIPPYRRIYISRKFATKRFILNEEDVISYLKDKWSFEVHYFEHYSFEEQVKIISEAKYLIGLHGAGLTNMIFMPKGGSVFEIRGSSKDRNDCFEFLSNSCGHNYYSLFNQADIYSQFDFNVQVNLNELEMLIKKEV